MIRYCVSNGLPIRPPGEARYSTDANLLGLTHEAGELESLATAADLVEPGMGVRAADAPNRPEQVAVVFEKGRPAAVGGADAVDAADVFEKANAVAGRNAVGINLHLVENRFVGVKSRGVYEAPGMELLGTAYAFLLQLVLDRRARRVFDFCSSFLAEQYYQGYGEDLASQLAKDVTAQVASLVSGEVVVELYKGNVGFVRAARVPHSIYLEENASMSNVGEFDHADSEGFLRVLGIGARAVARKGQVRDGFER
jgi:argininosuccinate synthase